MIDEQAIKKDALNEGGVKKNRGFTRIKKAAFYSYKGVLSAFRHEAAFRQEVFFAIILIPLAHWLDVSHIERVLLVGCVVLVLIVELLNSGIEAVVDRVGYEHHELAGRAKDLGSAAVSISLILWAYVWATVLFGEHLAKFFGS